MKYLLWLLCTKPVWAWHILWYSYPNNPVNRSNRHIGRVREYNQLAFPLAEVLQKACGASPERVNDVLKLFRGVPFCRDSDTEIIPAASDASEELAELCYCIVRLREPSTVVETGVGRGVTSYYVLRALEENAKGHLCSIELPWLRQGYSHEVGKFVPASLRSRWTLIFGPGVREMRRILGTVGSIDIFIHDSAHTYLNQLAEYRIALTAMTTGGILVSDDVGNNALLEVSEQFGCQPIVTTQRDCGYIGIIVKTATTPYRHKSVR